MGEMREKRLARERAELLANRRVSAVNVLRTYKQARCLYTDVLPEGPDFCDLASLKAILEQPADVTVDESSFSEILPSLPSLVEQWQNNIKATIAKHFHTWENSDYADAKSDHQLLARMKLASTVFRCTRCEVGGDSFDEGLAWSSQPLFYPAVLGHVCLTRSSDPPWLWDFEPEPISRLDNYPKCREKWSVQPLLRDRHFGQIVEAIVEAAGMDPSTTTTEELDNLGLWFACVRCAKPVADDQYRTGAYGWRDAVGYQYFFKSAASLTHALSRLHITPIYMVTRNPDGTHLLPKSSQKLASPMIVQMAQVHRLPLHPTGRG